jgi:hypothetical protein
MMKLFLSFLLLLNHSAFGQTDWKLEKDKDNIKVYTSTNPNSSYKSVKVECLLKGNYNQLIAVLTNVEKFKDWIYNQKTSKLVKRNTPYDFIYYSEIHMPWPISNRDVLIHMQIKTDSLPKFLLITGRNVNGILPEIPTRVRVPHYIASWKITMPSNNQLRISYRVDLDPGGSIPAWAANMFAEKGPFGTFSQLAEQLLK